jgi:hypothetical protein
MYHNCRGTYTKETQITTKRKAITENTKKTRITMAQHKKDGIRSMQQIK